MHLCMNRRVEAALRLAAMGAVVCAAVPAAAHAQTAPADPPPAVPPATPPAVPAPAATAPKPGARIFAGLDRRWTVGGRWLIRRDLADSGRKDGWFKPGAATGWTAGTVPSVWNARDHSNESQAGGVVWYRRELKLPKVGREQAGGQWILRFERVAIDAIVWINGREVTQHRGAFEPFELRVPKQLVRKNGTITIVVRTDNRREIGDFPPLSMQKDGTFGGGWWNDGGIPREVTLRYADQFDVSPLQITPDLPCKTCAGQVRYRMTVTNVSAGTRKATISATIADRTKRLATVTLAPGKSQDVTGRIDIAKPRIWSPTRPALYTTDVTVDAASGARSGQRLARYRAKTGIRSVRVSRGKLQLNFNDVNLRGTGLHEMDEARGSAMTDRMQDVLISQARQLGYVMRGHYPLHPRMLEEADRLGLLVWSEIPVYQVRQSQMGKAKIRDSALRLLRTTIQTSAHHPSVFTWSVGNELTTNPGPPIDRYFKATRRLADAYDTSRPLSYARQVGWKYGCIPMYRTFDLIGLNDYFGWYGTLGDPLADPANLGPFLDSLRECYPDQAIMISETGAEANRDGPGSEPGTYGYQSDYARYHYAVYASKPWLSGAIWWGLREFRVRPNWAGGNPVPSPPWHAKGLLDRFGKAKPAWSVLRNERRKTNQLAPAPTAPVTLPAPPPSRILQVPQEAPDPEDAGDLAAETPAATR